MRQVIAEMMMEFLKSDVGMWDVTSTMVDEKKVRARVIAKGEGILAGIEEVAALLDYLGMNIRKSRKDGTSIRKKDIVLEFEGNARDILSAERTILNVLMQMSGIATQTHRLQGTCSKHNVRVASTRKTTPGFSYFQKKAVAVGGGDTHRFGLYDSILIKNNHLKLLGITEALTRARKESFTKKIEIEVGKESDALRAAQQGVDIIMLDNMSPEDTRRIIENLDARGLRRRVIVEASGINIEKIEEYARTGVDVISTSKLVNCPWLDMSMEII
jgi:nicotinate-nucleotide pyrophosphorylase (carboxylating)